LNAIAHYPERFDALILSDTHCLADTPEFQKKRKKSIKSIKKNGVSKYVDESIKNLFAPESFDTKKEEIETIKEMMLKAPEQTLCKTLLAFSEREETCSALPGIEVPVLIMSGKDDKIYPPDAARFMHGEINGSILKIIDHAGHVSNIENPDEFNFRIKKFVDSVYPAS
jgi:pimeloyl-ACP methyl ester carboxylesterase